MQLKDRESSGFSALGEVGLKEELRQEIERRRKTESDPIDAVALLNEHPELWAQRSFVIELAYEEYAQRTDGGLAVDSERFCDKFPGYSTALRRVLALHQIVDQNPSLFQSFSSSWPQVGQSWLGFSLIDELGRGAFSRVYLALEESVGQRMVALKVSKSGSAEASVLGRLAHPHIVPIHGIHHDADGGWTAISMPYRGRFTLEDVKDGRVRPISRGLEVSNLPHRGDSLAGIPPSVAFRIGAQIASALHAAHAQKIVHGDLKPSNVLVDDQGNACLLDFNLAATLDEKSMLVGGTLPYMAPEQLQRIANGNTSIGCDSRSDIFSLGVILHELLTGRHPYEADITSISRLPLHDAASELFRRQQDALTTLHYPGLERQACQILRSCLSLDIDKRTADTAGLARSLQSRSAAFASFRRWAISHPLIVFCACLTIGVASTVAIVWLATRPSEAEQRFIRGLHEARAHHFDDSARHLQQSLSSDPDAIRPRLALAYVYQARGDLSLALAEYEILRKRHQDPRAAAGVAYCSALLGNQEVAIAAGQEALKQGHRSPAILNNLAFSFSRNGQFDEAISLLDEAIDSEQDSSVLFLSRAVCRWMQAFRMQQAAPDDALTDIQSAIALNTDDPALQVVAARIVASRIGNDPDAAVTLNEFLSTAVMLGWDPRSITKDAILAPFAGQSIVQTLPRPEGEVRVLPEPDRLIVPFTLEGG